MGKLLDAFKAYLKETSPEEQEKDWDRIKKWNDIGPDVMEYFSLVLGTFPYGGVVSRNQLPKATKEPFQADDNFYFAA